jgi:hypothetical protein
VVEAAKRVFSEEYMSKARSQRPRSKPAEVVRMCEQAWDVNVQS